MQKTQKVRNWKKYNQALRKRGGLIFSFDENFLESLYFSEKQMRGGVKSYSPQMFEYLLTLKITLRLPWRAAMGFAESLLKKAFPKSHIAIPDFAHASRQSGKLDLKLKQYLPRDIDGIELAFDSTGVNVYANSGWHQRKHCKNGLRRKREQWKKIHIAMDLNTMQVMSVAYTDSNTNDCLPVEDMCKEISGKVKSVRADGAYDTKEIYKKIYDWGAIAMIPPASTSKAQNELKHPAVYQAYLEQRDATIRMIRTFELFADGLKHWKMTSGYHRRSQIEAFMFRLKRTFGFNLQQQTDRGRKNEIITKMNVLNFMASCGRAEYST